MVHPILQLRKWSEFPRDLALGPQSDELGSEPASGNKAGLPWSSCPEALLCSWGPRSSATALCPWVFSASRDPTSPRVNAHPDPGGLVGLTGEDRSRV